MLYIFYFRDQTQSVHKNFEIDFLLTYFIWNLMIFDLLPCVDLCSGRIWTINTLGRTFEDGYAISYSTYFWNSSERVPVLLDGINCSVIQHICYLKSEYD